MRRSLHLCLLTCLFCSCVFAAPFSWDSNTQGAFVTCLARDHAGRIWAGTEDNGVWRFDPNAAAATAWTQFSRKDGLGDDSVYALCVDKQNRVWAGTLRHGISVYNGQTWRNYDALHGSGGERVFSVALNPADGDVWLATNAGLTRYLVKGNTWRTYTQLDGLPSLAIGSVACDAVGNVYAGTQADGLAIASPRDAYQKWRVVLGPESQQWQGHGTGLPSSLVSDVLISDDDTIYVSTSSGLARSYDAGASWSWIRGLDYPAKARGLLKPVTAELKGDIGPLLREDYLTSLSEDASGQLWLGYRQRGFEVRKPDAQFENERILFKQVPDEKVSDARLPYVSAILPLEGGNALLAAYGEGVSLVQATGVQSAALPATSNQTAQEAPELPSPTKAPTLDELNSLLKQVGGVAADDGKPLVAALPDDWQTQGDWLGRYGRYYARLCAMLSPGDYVWGAGEKTIAYNARIGPNANDGDSIRYWVHWLNTDNPRSLEMTQIYYHSRLLQGLVPQEDDPAKQQYRRQAEIDDHGEEYPMSKDGPHLYATFTVPDGVYWLSLYDFNKDGHDSNNRLRDYRVSIRSHPDNAPLEDISSFATQPELAHARIRDFWGGVYKRFLVRGPQTLTVEVNRNYSFNTILAGVFLDEVNEEPTPYFQTVATATPQTAIIVGDPASDAAKAADALWRELERVKTQNPAWWAQNGRNAYARLLLWLQNAQTTPPDATPELYKRMGTCYASLSLFSQWEQMQQRRGLTTARDIEKALRWDKKTLSYVGRGRETILTYLVAQKANATNP